MDSVRCFLDRISSVTAQKRTPIFTFKMYYGQCTNDFTTLLGEEIRESMRQS